MLKNESRTDKESEQKSKINMRKEKKTEETKDIVEDN